MATPRSDGDSSLAARPPMAISPPEASSRPAIVRSRVDLPHPEGPTKTTNSPSAMSRSIPLRTSVVPTRLAPPVSRTSAIFPARRCLPCAHRKRLQEACNLPILSGPPTGSPCARRRRARRAGPDVSQPGRRVRAAEAAAPHPDSAGLPGLVGLLRRRLAPRVLRRPRAVAALGLALPRPVARGGGGGPGVGARDPGRRPLGGGLLHTRLLARRRRAVGRSI